MTAALLHVALIVVTPLALVGVLVYLTEPPTEDSPARWEAARQALDRATRRIGGGA